ncbi:MAG: hypothetical protein AAF456_16260 [Planctomycetota bacterium]
MSTFGDEKTVELIRDEFIPVAIDQWYTRSQEDAEGEFYRRIAAQGPRTDFEQTTQGFYLADAAGNLLGYNNNRHGTPLKRLLIQTANSFNENETFEPIVQDIADERYTRVVPEGTVTVRVNAKILGGYDEPESQWDEIFQNAVSRDNLWILSGEIESLSRGEFPVALATRIARFHLVDNTRGEPVMWRADQVKELEISLSDGLITGNAYLETDDGKRHYRVALRGHVEFEDGRLSRFDIVALGKHFGHGWYTPDPPDGEFPLAVTFRLADGSSVSDSVPPQGTKGWLPQYVELR